MSDQVIRLLGLTTILAGMLGVAAASDGCVSCHSSPEFFSQYPKLDRYYQDWVKSPHAMAEVGCADCHGGDPAAEGIEEAHKGMLHITDPESTLNALNQPATCGDCHRNKRNQFTRSKHFQALMDDRMAPTCTTCHPAMNRRPAYRAIVLNACRHCHAEGNETGLPLIGDQAERAFQQLDIAGGFLGWATLHFQSHGWPNDSKDSLEELSRRHEQIVDRIHRFDMDETEAASMQLQADLRLLFEKERSAQDEQP